jgi:hypothetical protein
VSLQEIFIGRQRVTVDPDKPLGAGGEARVYDIGKGLVAKVYHDPSDPLLMGDANEQRAARHRLDGHQSKLPAFPRNLPAQIVAPVDLVHDKAGRIIGYVMPRVNGGEVLFKYGQPKFRQGIADADMMPILRDLYDAVTAVHGAGLVLGDFNDKNVLVVGEHVRLVDADSMQFGKFLCMTYTTTFVDPMVCDSDPQSGAPVLARPHTTDTDWYAFTTMVMRSLLYVDAYGGVYVAPPGAPKVTHGARPMHRITVWSAGVTYPKPARPYGILNDELLQHLHDTFEHDKRVAFPRQILDRMRWTTCTTCGTEHARARCPKIGCGTAAPAVAPAVTTVTVSGDVTATVVYQGRGVIVRVDSHLVSKKSTTTCRVKTGPGLLFLAHEDDGAGGCLRREDGAKVLAGPLVRAMRYRCVDGTTFLAMGDRVLEMRHGDTSPATQRSVDTIDGAPVFQTAGGRIFWTEADALWRARTDPGGGIAAMCDAPDRIGAVLSGQTRFWVGERFGFGFYRASAMTVGFVFGLGDAILNDSVRVRVRGTLLDATCSFDDHDHVWFFTMTQEGPRTVNRCQLVRADGTVVATAEADNGDGTWLGGIRGSAAIVVGKDPMLLAPTDDGIVRIEVRGSSLVATRTFAGTDQHVNAGCRVVVADGVYVVSGDSRKITRLSMVGGKEDDA